jgi:hypothetical protein
MCRIENDNISAEIAIVDGAKRREDDSVERFKKETNLDCARLRE